VGHVGPTTEFFSRGSTSVAFVRSQDVRPGKLNVESCARITPEFHAKLKKSQLRGGDILVVRVGANRGDSCVVPHGLGQLNCANIIFARPLIDTNFFGYFTRSEFGQNLLLSATTGAAQGVINTHSVAALPVPVPPLDEQRRIASILSAYDDLIENNTRRIAILEEMARRIYEEWFVHFRFPGHERARMVDSELGPVPEGWTIEPLNNLVDDVREAVDPESLDPDSPYVGLEHLPRRSIALSEWGEAGAVQSTKLRFREGDILFGKIRPYFHKVAVAPIAGVASSDAIIIRPKQASCFALALSAVSSDAFIAHATQTSNGTKMPRANWNVLRNYPVVLPIDHLKSRFDEFVNNSVATIKNFVRQNRNLRITRDLLLPKLISGELDVSPLPEPEAVAA